MRLFPVDRLPGDTSTTFINLDLVTRITANDDSTMIWFSVDADMYHRTFDTVSQRDKFLENL